MKGQRLVRRDRRGDGMICLHTRWKNKGNIARNSKDKNCSHWVYLVWQSVVGGSIRIDAPREARHLVPIETLKNSHKQKAN
jgi:hypothetical protein